MSIGFLEKKRKESLLQIEFQTKYITVDGIFNFPNNVNNRLSSHNCLIVTITNPHVCS